MSVTSAQHAVRLRELLSHLPAAQHAVAYGSGVFVQPGLYDGKSNGPMVDFLLAVEDPLNWHQQVTGLAEHVGVGVHFNTLVNIQGQAVKYGVASVQHWLDDVSTWRYLYLAGRLQKPVLSLVNHTAIDQQCVRNHHCAAVAALLLSSSSFTTKDLLRTIVGLSYHGDVRMGLAEDPHKIDRIVDGSRQHLLDLYVPILHPSAPPSHTTAQGISQSAPTSDSPQQQQQQHTQPSQAASTSSSPSTAAATKSTAAPFLIGGNTLHNIAGLKQSSDSTWSQDIHPDVRAQLIAALPPALLTKIGSSIGYHVPESHCAAGSSTAVDVAWAVVKTGQHEKLIRSALANTVRASSFWQAMSGALATGGGKAVTYLGAKIKKATAAAKKRQELDSLDYLMVELLTKERQRQVRGEHSRQPLAYSLETLI